MLQLNDIRPIISAGENFWPSRLAMKQDLPGLVASQRTKSMTETANQASRNAQFDLSSSDVLGIQAFTGVKNLDALEPDAIVAARDLARSTARRDVAILAPGGAGGDHAAIAEELAARGANVRMLDSSRLRVRGDQLQFRPGEKGTAWHDIAMPEAVVSRGAHSRLVEGLDRAGVHMVNRGPLRSITLDKGAQADVFNAYGVPHPATVKGLSTLDDVLETVKTLPRGPKGEFVVKKVNGHGGEGTWVVRSEDHLRELAAKHFPPVKPGEEPHELLVQQYLELGSADYRASVVRDVNGKAVLRSVHHRQGLGTDGLANGPEGSKYTRIPLQDADPEIERVAVAATDALGAAKGMRGMDYAGVDVVKASDGKHYVLEINGTAGVSEHDIPLPRGGRNGATQGEHNLPYVADWAVWGGR